MSITRQVVNDNDVVIGHKSSADMDYYNDIYRVSALWLTNSKGEILIAQRTLSDSNSPGLWGPAAAGTLEEGESYEQNIYKEAEEEIGITGVIFKRGLKIRFSSPRHYFCQMFEALIDLAEMNFVIQKEEVAAVKWVSSIDLMQQLNEKPDSYINEMKIIADIFIKDGLQNENSW